MKCFYGLKELKENLARLLSTIIFFYWFLTLFDVYIEIQLYLNLLFY